MDSANIEIFSSILKRFIQKALQSKTKRLWENLPKRFEYDSKLESLFYVANEKDGTVFDDLLSPRERKFVIAPVPYYFMWSQRSEVIFLKGQDDRFSVRWPKCGLEHPFTSRLLHQKYFLVCAKHNISSTSLERPFITTTFSVVLYSLVVFFSLDKVLWPGAREMYQKWRPATFCTL